jgi:hypothetical protein
LITDNDYETAQLSLQIAVEGHLMAFAAELSRISGQIVDFEAYRHTVLKSLDSKMRRHPVAADKTGAQPSPTSPTRYWASNR